MVQPIDQTIVAAIAGRDVGRGASLLIVESGRFLVAARPPFATDSRVLINLTGIGGWVEAGETFSEAMHREACEETGVDIDIIDLRETLIVRGPDAIEEVCIVGEPGPAAIVYCRIGTPAFDPWASDFASMVAVTVYAGRLRERPAVVAPEEHPFFLWLYPEQLIALSDGELPLDFLLSDGAELQGELVDDPGRSLVRLNDSIPSLLTALGPSAFTFLGNIARLSQPAHIE